MTPVGRPRRMAGGRVVVVVWCGQCTAEGVRHRGRLGHTERPAARSMGQLVWVHAGGVPKAWGMVRRAPAFVTLVDKNGRTTTELPASCPRHGVGRVRAGDVLTGSGSVVLDLIGARA